MAVQEERRNVQTTVRLPKPLYEQAKWFVDKHVSTAHSINDFIVAAIRAYVKMLRRKRIDQAFSGMAEDTSYQRQAEKVAEEFEQSDWEALETAGERAGEEESTDAHPAR